MCDELEITWGTLESICSNLVSSWVKPLRSSGMLCIVFHVFSLNATYVLRPGCISDPLENA